MTHYDTKIIAYNSVIIVTRFADDQQGQRVTPVWPDPHESSANEQLAAQQSFSRGEAVMGIQNGLPVDPLKRPGSPPPEVDPATSQMLFAKTSYL